MNYSEEVIHQIELHSPEGIKECFSKGVSPNDDFKGQPLIYELISEYTRSPRFKDCVRVFVDHGMRFEDEILLSVLLDDAASLEKTTQPGSRSCYNNIYPSLRLYTALHSYIVTYLRGI
jgi:hypothetical protein